MAATVVIACPQCAVQLKGPSDLVGKKVRCKGCGHVFVAQSNETPDAVGAAPARSKSDEKTPDRPSKAPTGKPDKSSKAEVPGEASTKTAPASGGGATAPVPPGTAQVKGNLNVSAYGIVTDEKALEAISNSKKVAPSTREAAAKGSKVDPYGLTDTSLKALCPYCAQELPDEKAVICLNCGFNLQLRQRTEIKRTHHITAVDILLWRLPGIICATLSLLLVLWIGWLFYLSFAETNENAWYAWMNHAWFRWWGILFSLAALYFLINRAYYRLWVDPMPPEIEKKK